MSPLGDIAKALNRAPVYLAGLQKRFELPVFEGAAYSEVYVAFLRCGCERVGSGAGRVGVCALRPDAGGNQNRGGGIEMNPLNLTALRKAVAHGNIEWRKHILQKLAERAIAQQDVRDVLMKGERIRDYPDDPHFQARSFWVMFRASRFTSWRRATKQTGRRLSSRPTSHRWKSLKPTIEPNESYEREK